jgi:dTDP-4-dehydrorhamnose reductase
LNNKSTTVLVTGANGQLGNELHVLAPCFTDCVFLFVSKDELNIADSAAVSTYFTTHSIDYCINCAAYTAVDKAEVEKEQAFLINAEAVGTLAKVCNKNNTQLIHISTDYVFDGTATQPYTETDKTNPVSIYGQSKLKGEELAMQNCPSSIIIRTSWLYSSFKNNFVKTMLRLMKEKESINVVNDQFGCPTYAADLADAIIQIIKSGKSKENPGIYNYVNAGTTTWFEFAIVIKELSKSNCIINPIPTTQYPTPAKRPAYSVLDTTKIQEAFNIVIPEWKDSLQNCLELLK